MFRECIKMTRSIKTIGSQSRWFSTGSRKFFVGGNWKCNPKSLQEADGLLEKMNNSTAMSNNSNTEVVIATPTLFLSRAAACSTSNFAVSAQDCSPQGLGAYTGETSPDMLTALGIKYTVVGHSERRSIQGESDSLIASKCKYAQEQGLTVIGCIGELLEERQAEKTMEVCQRQLSAYAKEMKSWDQFVLAYEPVWAIGTGMTATPDQAQQVHSDLRKWLAENISPEVANNLRIIYGGSVSAENCDELSTMADVDGFLVGGASLKPDQFEKIATCTN
mmetsp:Transcript_6506/g.8276  ORF Transcript_6506/g.8276 Transcript_6506/m.8276 type:complete len:277 (-) Transcript_6506:305-1135(-)